MVLGMGEGSLEIKLDKTKFVPGEKITGRVQLQLNKPMPARELRMDFYGLVRRSKYYEKVCEVKQQLGPERSYRSGESFDFSLTIPPGVVAYSPFSGILGNLYHTVLGNFYDANARRPRWFVDASLDMPMKIDINKKLQVEITFPAPASR